MNHNDAQERCPTCGSDDPRYVDAHYPEAGDLRRYIWMAENEVRRPHWHCPDPFHRERPNWDKGERWVIAICPECHLPRDGVDRETCLCAPIDEAEFWKATVVPIARLCEAETRAEAAEQRAAERMSAVSVEPSAYTVRRGRDPLVWITVQRSSWQSEGSEWAIRCAGRCLNRDGEWEIEPIPSSRDADLLARCRFDRDDALRRAEQAPDIFPGHSEGGP